MRVLLLHDIEKDSGQIVWAYGNRTLGLLRAVPKGIQAERLSQAEVLDGIRSGRNPIQDFDIVFNLDYQSAAHVRHTLMRDLQIPMVSSFNKDASTNTEYWAACYVNSDFVICNNASRYEWAVNEGYERVCYITNGVDTDFWRQTTMFDERPFDIGWCGSVAPKKKKGYLDTVVPLKNLLDQAGITHSIRPIINIEDKNVYPRDKQLEWYNQCKLFLCVSQAEGGGPSSLMEAMACGCIPVTVRIGSVAEFCENGWNSAILDSRSPESILARIQSLLSHDDELSAMCVHARESMLPYSYGSERGPDKWFYRLFQRIHQRQQVPAFDCREVDWSVI